MIFMLALLINSFLIDALIWYFIFVLLFLYSHCSVEIHPTSFSYTRLIGFKNEIVFSMAITLSWYWCQFLKYFTQFTTSRRKIAINSELIHRDICALVHVYMHLLYTLLYRLTTGRTISHFRFNIFLKYL